MTSGDASAWLFTYEAEPQRVIFGPGQRVVVGDEVDRLGAERAVLISGATPEIGDELAAVLGARLAGRWDEFVQHVPVELAERARAFVDERRADVVVSVGGGSATGLAKAIALTHRLPIVAVPTTYAGSEQTPIYGLTGDRNKQTGRDPIVKPVSVVYDTELTLVLPPEVTGPSAFNALAHSVEGMYATGHNPVTTALALEAIGAIARSLPVVMGRPDDLDARASCSTGRTCRGSSSARRPPGSTTSSPTCSAGRTTSSTPTPTPCCFPTSSRSTRPPCPPSSAGSPARSASPTEMPRRRCGSWRRRATCRRRWPT